MTWLRSDREVALNELVRALREAADRHATAADRAEDEELGSLLRETAGRREAAADTLVDRSEAEAAVPDPDAEFFHDVVAEAKAALAGDTDQAVKSDVLQIEAVVREAATDVLEYEPSDRVRDVVRTVLDDIAAVRGALES
jgi:uncharacterized protein (TIGR02284 family)